MSVHVVQCIYLCEDFDSVQGRESAFQYVSYYEFVGKNKAVQYDFSTQC